MKRILTLGLSILLAAAIVSACGTKADSPEPGTNNTQGAGPGNAEEQGSGQDGDSGEPGQAPIEEQQTISVYRTDVELLDLYEAEAAISFEGDGKYLAALEALRKNGDDGRLSLWEHVAFNSADFSDGSLVIDLHLPDEARLGAPGEALAIEALLRTLFQFSEVQSITVLVDGEQVDSLMGHVVLEQPFDRNYLQ